MSLVKITCAKNPVYWYPLHYGHELVVNPDFISKVEEGGHMDTIEECKERKRMFGRVSREYITTGHNTYSGVYFWVGDDKYFVKDLTVDEFLEKIKEKK